MIVYIFNIKAILLQKQLFCIIVIEYVFKFDNERVRSLKEILKQQYAIIDIGSNTMRLVIYEKQNGGFYKEIENTKVVARLRNYLIDGVLNEEE